MKLVPGLLGACLVLTACTGTDTTAPTVTVTAPPTSATQPAPPSPDPATLTWMDGFCAAINGYRERTNREAKPAQPDPTTVAEAQRRLSALLGGMAARTGEVVDRLSALPPAPVPLAETVRQAFVTKFTTSRDRAGDAKTALDHAKPGDQASQDPAGQALEQAQQDVDGMYDPVAPMAASPELMLAAGSAPGCKI
ncbi:hypothetical protein M8542_37220 [Amycolatopsis sp. OK19-0408]|uniref:Lipoprotein n=1 Tax=Amycolatopsis iheyensis TaxID=2945988 RepID=A0A9X2SQD2_9PSEU|nr:hypothetical protein [Amycolatopsis iheyensis]MCR6488485.1 hypothetical protein [Amycolatopsis iheyensis]